MERADDRRECEAGRLEVVPEVRGPGASVNRSTPVALFERFVSVLSADDSRVINGLLLSEDMLPLRCTVGSGGKSPTIGSRLRDIFIGSFRALWVAEVVPCCRRGDNENT